MNRYLAALLLLLAACTSGSPPSQAQQSVLQGGSWSAGQIPTYSISGTFQPIVQSAGPASGVGVGLNEIAMIARGSGSAPYIGTGTGPLGSQFCMYDGPITSAAGYHYLCMSPNVGSAGLLTYGFGGAASPQPLNFVINGTTYQFPFSSGGVIGPGSSVVNNLTCWNNTSGTLLKDCGVAIGTSGGAVPVLNAGNTWSAGQTFASGVTVSSTSSISGTLTLSGTTNVTGTFQASGNTITLPTTVATLAYIGSPWGDGECVQASGTAGMLVTTGSACGSGGGGGSPGGVSTNVQYNNAGSFAGNNSFTYNGSGQIALGQAGSVLGSVAFRNTTSGTITLAATTGALGTVTLSLPAATDTLVGRATTDTLTNKTFNTAATGNILQINGTGITAVTGTGSVVLATSPALVTPNIGSATGTQLIMSGVLQVYAATPPPAGGTTNVGVRMSTTGGLGVFFGTGAPTLSGAIGALYISDQGAPYYNNNGSTGWTQMTVGTPAGSNSQIQYNNAGALGANAGFTYNGTSLITLGVASSSTGSVQFNSGGGGLVTVTPGSTASTGTLTLPAATDTLVGKATTDVFTNKTFNTGATGNVFQIAGTGITAVTGTGAVVLETSPALVTPNIGSATGTQLVASGVLQAYAATAPPTGGTTNVGLRVSSTGGFGVFFGAGVPTLSAATGSLYISDQGAPYFNNNGSTGWTQITAGGGSGTVNSGTTGKVAYYATNGTTVSATPRMLISGGQLYLGESGVDNGLVTFLGAAGSMITLAPSGTGTGVLSLPDTTDTLVVLSAAQTLSGKTFVAPVLGAATGTSLSVTGGLTAYSGTSTPAGGASGSGVLLGSSQVGMFWGSGSPTLSAAQGSLYLRSDGVPYYNTNGSTGWTQVGSGSGTVNAGIASELAYYSSSGTAVNGAATVTISAGQLTIGVAGTTAGSLRLSGASSGTTTLVVASSASGTLTLPASTDTLVGRATTDTLTNKTLTNPTIAAASISGTANFLGTFQYGSNTITFPATAATLLYKTGAFVSGECLQASGTAGLLITTGAPCGGSGSSPGGSNTQVQYNNMGNFGGAAGFTYDGTSAVTVGVVSSTTGTLTLNSFLGGYAQITAGNTSVNAVLTLPSISGSDTLVALAATQTLSNKTLTAPVIGAATGTSLSVTGALTAYSGTAVPAGGTTGSGVKMSSTSNLGLFFGSGAPTLSAAQGSLYMRTDGAPYYNTDGSTGWALLGGGGGSGTVSSGTAGQFAFYNSTGTTVVGYTNLTASAGQLTVGIAGTNAGSIRLSGATSGTTTLVVGAIASGTLTLPSTTDTVVVRNAAETLTNKVMSASGADSSGFAYVGSTGTTILKASATASGTLTLPAATDTLIGKATTDTLTNKTYDTAGTGNSFSINGVAVTANTGTGAVARATSPSFTTPNIGAASGTSLSVSGALTAYNGTAIPAGGTGGVGILLSSTSNMGMFFGSGAPTLSAAQGSIYLRSDGVPYYNNNGSTGWTALAGGGGSGTVNSGVANELAYYSSSGTAVSGNSTLTVSGGALTVGVAGSVAGTVKLSGAVSGTVTLAAPTAASGTQTVPAGTGTLLSTAGGQTIAGGYTYTAYSGGTITSGTYTPTCTNAQYQYLTNNGSFTIAAPSGGCAIALLITNGASAGTITFSGYTVGSSTGDAFTTTNGNKFVVTLYSINGTATYMNKALQ